MVVAVLLENAKGSGVVTLADFRSRKKYRRATAPSEGPLSVNKKN